MALLITNEKCLLMHHKNFSLSSKQTQQAIIRDQWRHLILFPPHCRCLSISLHNCLISDVTLADNRFLSPPGADNPRRHTMLDFVIPIVSSLNSISRTFVFLCRRCSTVIELQITARWRRILYILKVAGSIRASFYRMNCPEQVLSGKNAVSLACDAK